MINNIIQNALNQPAAATGWKADKEDNRLLLKAEGDTYGWHLVIRKGLRNIHLPTIEKEMADRQPSLLVTDHLLPGIWERLRSSGLSYLDDTGNIFLKGKRLLILLAEHLVFKGGTSLSKGWNLIERFSEDIDLAIDRKYFGFDGTLKRKQIDKLRKTAGTFVDDQFIAPLQEKLSERSFDKVVLEIEPGERTDRDRTILLHYPNVIAFPGYLPPRIKIEFSCRSLMEPSSLRNFGATVDEAFPTATFVETPVTVPVVNPERTMLEKIFLLHEEFQKPTERIRKGDRLSRHLYDTARLSTSKFAAMAFASPHLYQMIVVHRAIFNTLSGVDYSRHAPATIQIIPPDAVLADWKNDYATMMEEMIYEENKPSFEELMVTLNDLNKRINALDWKIE